MFQLPLDIRLDDAAQLENFYAGENRQLVQRLSELAHQSSQFYFVWGLSGAGKSHLAQAVCRQLSEQHKAAVYLPLNNQQLAPEVLHGLEFADLVCLDSLQSVAGDASWEEALFDLFNRIKLSDKNLVIMSQPPLKDLEINLADLVSRLSSMEIYKLNSISDSHQLEFIKKLAQYRGLEIPTEVANFLIVRTDRNVKQLVNMINLLDQQSLAHQRKITIPFVKQILSL